MFCKTIIAAVSLGSGVLAGIQAYDPPTTVSHDSLKPVDTILGQYGKTIQNFQPFLHIAHGCQVYTAVDKENHYSGGLQDTGSTDGGCRDTEKGQVYVRTKHLDGRFGIMYAWYWPKDHPAAGDVFSGHRHEWEGCVVWLDSSSETARLEGAACSSHDGWTKSTNPKREGRRVKVEYFTSGGKNHELQFSDTKGKDFPIYDWDKMPGIVKHVLNEADFKDANCPLNEYNFDTKMEEARV